MIALKNMKLNFQQITDSRSSFGPETLLERLKLRHGIKRNVILLDKVCTKHHACQLFETEIILHLFRINWHLRLCQSVNMQNFLLKHSCSNLNMCTVEKSFCIETFVSFNKLNSGASKLERSRSMNWDLLLNYECIIIFMRVKFSTIASRCFALGFCLYARKKKKRNENILFV